MAKHWRNEWYDDRFLGHWDFENGPIKLLIDRTEVDEAYNPNTSKREAVRVMYFTTQNGTPCKKGLVLNKTKLKAIESWHGGDPDEWKGKEIELRKGQILLKGVQTDCVKVVAQRIKKGNW